MGRSIGVKLKIDVTNIEKARLFQGKKGTYLDATVFINVDEKDQYENNGMITQDVTKAEKESGVKGPILGNVQVFWDNGATPMPASTGQAVGYQPAPQAPPQQAPNFVDDSSDVPF